MPLHRIFHSSDGKNHPVPEFFLTKLSKNSPTSSGSEMNCGAEHKCSKESCK